MGRKKKETRGVTYQHPETRAEALAMESAGRLGARKLVICPDCGQGYKSGYGHPDSDWCRYSQHRKILDERNWVRINVFDAAVLDVAGVECDYMLVDVTQERGKYRGVGAVEGWAGPSWAAAALEMLPTTQVPVSQWLPTARLRRREREQRRALVIESLALPENEYARLLVEAVRKVHIHRANRIKYEYVRPALQAAAAVSPPTLRNVSAKLQQRFAMTQLRASVRGWRAIYDPE